MTSLQQTPTKGQQVPPPKMIDGVSEQQIDAAVKAHVGRRRVTKPAAARQTSVLNERAAIETALNYIEHRLKWLGEMLMDDCAEGVLKDAVLVQFVGQVALEELQRLRAEGPTCFDEADERLAKISSLCYCMERAYSSFSTDTTTATVLARLQSQIDAVAEAIEIGAMVDARIAKAAGAGVAA